MTLLFVLFNGSKIKDVWDPTSPYYIDDWKPEHKIIKGVQAVQVTYGSSGDVKLHFPNGDIVFYQWDGDYLVVDGIFYGDFTVEPEEGDFSPKYASCQSLQHSGACDSMRHRDTITIGSAPLEENCVQVNKTGDYLDVMYTECKLFKEMLEKVFPEPPQDTYFKITSNPHDFGTYYEVVVSFVDVEEEAEADPTSDELGVEYALFVESHTPDTWDDTEVFDKLRRAQVRQQAVVTQLGRS